MELTGTVHLSLLDPILVRRIENWIGEIGEVRATHAAIEEGDLPVSAYYDADERSSIVNEEGREILEWLLAEIGLWPEEEGAPNDQADPAPGG